MHTVEDVLGLLRAALTTLPDETVELPESCGRILARQVIMDIDAPPFDRAMRDGYALRAADAAPGAILQIIGRQDAGMESHLSLRPHTCIAINTGAKMVQGADAVIMVEDTLTPGGNPGPSASPRALAADSGPVNLLKSAHPGMNIQPRASDAAAGQQVLPPGTRLTPAAIAVAASAGAARVHVYRPARIAILTTGDEVVPVDQTPGPTQIRNTNGPMLASLARQMGAQVHDLGIAPDDPAAIRSALRAALDWADALIVTGGMSLGTKDLVPPILQDLGVQLLVESVKMKPGKPFLFGRLGPKVIFGLPGNPVSGFVCFVRFALPFLRAMMGAPFDGGLEPALCPDPLDPNPGTREFYQPAILTTHQGTLQVRPLAWRGSADIYTLAAANALIVHRPGEHSHPANTPVEILRLSSLTP